MCIRDSYEVTEGEVWLDGQNLLDMSIDERSRAGLFLAFQYPMAVPGDVYKRQAFWESTTWASPRSCCPSGMLPSHFWNAPAFPPRT